VSYLAHRQAGTSIRATRGNRAQWHANFKLDEFSKGWRELHVLHTSGAAEPTLRGMLILGPGHTLADAYHMLRTELQLWKPGCSLSLMTKPGGAAVALSDLPPSTDLLPLLPAACELLVRETDAAAAR